MSLIHKIIITLALALGIAMLYVRSFGIEVKKPKVGVTVFIHGTVGSTFTSLNPWQGCKDEIDQSTWSAQLVSKFRNYEYLGYDHIIGKEGFCECEPETLGEWDAARYLIPAYDDIAQVVGARYDVQKYAIFGWSGLLHFGARKKAGYQLYVDLCTYRDALIKKYGVEPEFTLIAHSHGGNVALWLAEAETMQKKNLHIKMLLMYGTPMQKAMAPLLQSPLFSTIILCYSQGDAIQTRDYFSSKDGKSYQKMADVIDITCCGATPTKRYDVRCLVNNKSSRITHTNMWLVGRSIALDPAYDLIPLLVFSPCIISLAGRLGEAVSADLHIKTDAGSCAVTMGRSPELCSREVLHGRLVHWNTLLHKEWQKPHDTARHPVFNAKTKDALWHVIWG